jgi:hypothetical protein
MKRKTERTKDEAWDDRNMSPKTNKYSYVETVYLLLTTLAVHLNLQAVNMLHNPCGEKKT